MAESQRTEDVNVVTTTLNPAPEELHWRAQTFLTNRDAIIITDLAGRILDWNPAAERMYGYSRDEALGNSTEMIHPAAPENAQTLTGAILHEMTSVGVWTGEIPFVRKDGTTGVCEGTVSPLLDAKGVIVGAFGVNRDVTEQKRAEAERLELLARERRARAEAEAERARLRTILDVLPVGVAIYDPNGELLELNVAGKRLTERDVLRGEDAARRQSRYAMRWADGSPMPEAESPSGRSRRGEPFDNLELIIAGSRGSDTHVLTSGAPLPPEAANSADTAASPSTPGVSGRLNGHRPQTGGSVVIFQDVTAQRRLEVEQIRTREAVQASEAAAQAQARELEAILDAMTDGVIVYAPGGRVSQANAALIRLFGYHLEPNFIHLPQAERASRVLVQDQDGAPVPVERLPQMRALAGETLTGSQALDLRVTTLYGTELEVNVSAAPIRNVSGEVVGAVSVFRDVTARRSLERETFEAAGRLRAILDLLPVGVSFVDARGKALIVNRQMTAIWGDTVPLAESREDFADYKGWWPSTGAAVAPEEWGLSRALASGEVTQAEEADIETFDGQRKTILSSAAPLRDEVGEIAGAMSVVVDITDRNRLERRTQEALDALLQMAQMLVALPDDASPAEDDPAPMSAALTPLRTPPEDDAHWRATSFENAERMVAQRLATLTCGVLGCSRVGITAVEPETERLRAVAVVGLTPEQEPQWWAEQREQESKGVRLGDGGDPAELARFRAGEVFVLDMTQPPLNALPNPYGVTTQLIAPMRAGDQLVGMLSLDYGGPPHIFTRDERALAGAVAQLGAVALEREHLLHERSEAQATALALRESNRRMDEFLSIASHELRTPLTTIKANVQMAARYVTKLGAADASATEDGHDAGPAIARLSHLLATAVSATQRQERLVQDLLDVSRIAAGKLEYRKEPLDVGALVREVVDEQRLTAPDRAITLDAPRMTMTAHADGDRIRQVISNYLTNALKYSPPEQPIVVALRRAGSGRTGRAARLDVRDFGPGLAPEQQARLFERFHRVPEIEVQAGSAIGLGLGLYISKTIIEHHHGQVGVESAPGNGSTFWFTLPLGTQSEDEEED